MITERHNIACRLIMKAIEAGFLGGCFVQMDIGLTKPTNPRRIYHWYWQQNRPRMALPLPVSF